MQIQSVQNQSFKGQLYPPDTSRYWIDDYESHCITRELDALWKKRIYEEYHLDRLFITEPEQSTEKTDKTWVKRFKKWVKTRKNKIKAG